VHIVETYGIFGDKIGAIFKCLNRFDADTKASFVDLYSKVDAGVDLNANTAPVTATIDTDNDIPF
jgi:cobaltochelatase CobS